MGESLTIGGKIKNFFTYETEAINLKTDEKIKRASIGKILFVGALVATFLLGMAATGTLVATGVFGLWGSVIWTFLGIESLSIALKVLIVVLSVVASGAVIGGVDLAAFFIFFSVVTKIEKKKEEEKKNKEFDPVKKFEIEIKKDVKDWKKWCNDENSTVKYENMHFNRDAGFKGIEVTDYSFFKFFPFRFINFLMDFEYFLIASVPFTKKDNDFSIFLQEDTNYNITVVNLDSKKNEENFFPKSIKEGEEKTIEYMQGSTLRFKNLNVLEDNDRFREMEYDFKNSCLLKNSDNKLVFIRQAQFYRKLCYLEATKKCFENVNSEDLRDIVNYLDKMVSRINSGRIIVCSSDEINKTSLVTIALMIKNYIKQNIIKKGISNSDLKKEVVKAIAVYAKERYQNKYVLYKDALLEEKRLKLLFDFAKLCLNEKNSKK